jgi:hypothetical protein
MNIEDLEVGKLYIWKPGNFSYRIYKYEGFFADDPMDCNYGFRYDEKINQKYKLRCSFLMSTIETIHFHSKYAIINMSEFDPSTCLEIKTIKDLY